jgi:hypothetical protein
MGTWIEVKGNFIKWDELICIEPFTFNENKVIFRFKNGFHIWIEMTHEEWDTFCKRHWGAKEHGAWH